MHFTLLHLSKLSKHFNVNWGKLEDYVWSLLLTVIITYGIIFIIRFSVHQFFKRTNIIAEKKEQTFESILKNTSNYIAFIIIVLSAIKPFVDIKQLLVAGGVIGVVIGFGAQTLIRDILNGIFMIFERTLQKGDFVSINGDPEGGTVEELGFRVIKIRLVSGKLLTIPNGEVKKTINGSVDRRRIFESVIVSFDENPARIKELLQEVCDELNEKHHHYLHVDKGGELIEKYRVYGLSSLDVSPLGYKLSISATVNDTDYVTAAQETKEVIAQKFFENKVMMPAQQLIMRS